jgi:molybdopterin-containing oxidoreductase family iron-sulfur binding subunit
MTKQNRRDFLRVLGWGGAGATVSACGFTSVDSGVETVKSYVEPEDFNVPGVGVYYASACLQCGGGCGVVGRVRDGRVLKLEGNAASTASGGKICGLGQAAVQHHYNPDRLRGAYLRKDGLLKPVAIEEALAELHRRLGATGAGRFALVGGPTSGHTQALAGAVTESMGAGARQVTYDPLGMGVHRAACQAVFGTESPRFALDEAQVIVSFGADFLDTWLSPVHFAGQYARFRKANAGRPRGTLVQIEPRMTLTGANADRWIGIRPGTEGVLALGLANALISGGKLPKGGEVPAGIAAAAATHDREHVLARTGVSPEAFDRLVALLATRTPALVLCGPSAEGHAQGSANARAVLALNWLLGAVGHTVKAAPANPWPQIAPRHGDTASLAALAADMGAGKFDTVLIAGSNPAFSAPGHLQFTQAFAKVSNKIVFAQYMDETAALADLVLPLDSDLESWGTHLASYPAGEGLELLVQQPLMERLYPDTRSTGDWMLEVLRRRRAADFGRFPDLYAYLRTALLANKTAFGSSQSDEDFWTQALSRGVLALHAPDHPLPAHAPAIALDFAGADAGPAPGAAGAAPAQTYPLHLVPVVRASLRDGRHANLPWMQETPDALTTIVWDSWAELHPSTARALGVSDGDLLEITSASGTVRAPAYIFPGVHPEAVAIPLGQGHEAMGRYAKDRGINPMRLIDRNSDRATGELALQGTRVRIARAGERVAIIKDEGWKSGNVKTQGGRKLVVTLAADKAKLANEV